ncbi:MAG TPA: hypothetical protein VHB25_08420, partial [Gemmatimonadaceae bacterium]|nr:hypothetical protein [Gemmatimonadaceae bacterium]
MRAHKHFRLRVLGTLALDTVNGEIASAEPVRPRHLAILCVLALSRRAVRRDALAAMFWGDETDAKARHSLSNALSALRAVLGRDAITARRDHLELSADLPLAVDAIEFAASCESHDDARAADLYRGPLMSDVFVQSAPDFDAWLARERGRLERAFDALCARRVPMLLRAQQWASAAALAEQWLRTSPRSTVAFTSVLRARSGPGTVAAYRAALSDFERLTRELRDQFGVHPDPVVLAVADELAARAASEELGKIPVLDPTKKPGQSLAGTRPGPVDSTGAGLPPAPDTPRRRRLSRARMSGAILLAGIVVVVGALRWNRTPRAQATDASRTIVAITSIANIRSDSSLAWLEDGLPQLITDNLSAAGGLEPVAPVRVRDVLARSNAPHTGLSSVQSLDVARRVGATWAVRGGYTGGNGAYVLDLDVREVRQGGEIESFTVMADDPVKLGQLAAARLLDIAARYHTASGEPPRFAGGTPDPEAYRHFVVGLRAASEGQFATARRELDAAIAVDSGFVEALAARRDIARGDGQASLADRLEAEIARHPDRASEWDRLTEQVQQAEFEAALPRADALSQLLVSRFPNDPRAYELRADILMNAGQFAAADTVFQHELSLDSLAIDAGDGPCAPCTAYSGLVLARLWRGDFAPAEQAARRWVSLQPAVAGAWAALAISLEFSGRLDLAIDAQRRTASLARDPAAVASLGRMMIAAHRFSDADSVIRVLRRGDASAALGAVDLEVTLARERGQFRRAVAILESTRDHAGLDLVLADNLARIGRLADARALYEFSAHQQAPRDVHALSPAQARAYAWA